MIVAVLGVVVTLLVFFSAWITIQLSRTQTALLEMNDVLSQGVVSLAEEMIELEKDMKGIEEDMSKHLSDVADAAIKDNENLAQHILDVSAEFRKDFLNREGSITRKLRELEDTLRHL